MAWLVLFLSALLGFSENHGGSNLSPADARTILIIQEEIARGDLASARRQLDSLRDGRPPSATLENLLGIIDAQEGNYGSAESEFRSAIRLQPALLSAYLNLGRLYSLNPEAGQDVIEKGIDVYRRALRLDPGSAEARYQLALLLEWRGAFAESLSALDALPSGERVHARVAALKSADLAGLGDLRRAHTEILRLIKLPDFSEEHASAIFAVLDKRGGSEIARPLLETMLSRSPEDSATLARLASLDEAAGQLNAARGSYEKVARIQPDAVQPLLDLARVAYKQRDLEGSLGYLAHARGLDPGNSKIHFFFGIVALESNLPIDAMNSLRKAAELEPGNAYIHYAMGLIALQGHDPGEAVPHFAEYARWKPLDPRGKFAIGAAEFYAGRYEDARRELRAVADRPETAGGAHYFLGRIAMVDDNLEEAQALLKEAVRRMPGYADGHAELGLVYIRQKEYAEAGRELEKALRLDPTNFFGNTNLLILYRRTNDERAKTQTERLKELQNQREKRQELLTRTIEVRPY